MGPSAAWFYEGQLRPHRNCNWRHLCHILGIRWQDKIPDVDVLERAKTVSVKALITASQLRWAGHVWRMPNNRLPKAVLYGELSVGKRNTVSQKLRYKDVLKRHMKNGAITTP